MKTTFEDYISFIENQLGIEFLAYQKEVLQMTYERQHYFIPFTSSYERFYLGGLKLLAQTIIKENDNE